MDVQELQVLPDFRAWKETREFQDTRVIQVNLVSTELEE